MNEKSTKNPWWKSWSFWGAAVVAFIIYLNSGKKTPEKGPAGQAAPPPRVLAPREIEEACAAQLQTELQTGFDKIKQQLFDVFHPIGRAKSITVHDVTIGGWKHGNVSGRADDILQLTTRFTIYWEGPITKDGFTKVNATWDGESQRWLPAQILTTNGVTNEQAANVFIGIAAKAISDVLRSQGN